MGLYLQHQRRGLPADGEGPLQLQTHRGTTGGAEDLDLDLKMRYSMRYHILAIPDRCKGMVIVPESTKATLEITQDTPNIMDPVH